MMPLADARAALGTVVVAEASAQATAVFPSSLPVFAGHFPGQPLVPGVATLALMIATYEAATTCSVFIAKVERSKWKSPGFPGDLLTVQIAWQADHDDLRLKGSVTCGPAILCEAVMVLRRR